MVYRDVKRASQHVKENVTCQTRKMFHNMKSERKTNLTLFLVFSYVLCFVQQMILFLWIFSLFYGQTEI